MNKLLFINMFMALALTTVFVTPSVGRSQLEKGNFAFNIPETGKMPINPSDYKGNVGLIAKVASKFGYLSQNEMFEQSYEKSKNQGGSKIVVKARCQSEFYRFPSDPEIDTKFSGEITWNFEKLLFSRDGNVIDRFTPKTRPDDPEVISSEKVLSKK